MEDIIEQLTVEDLIDEKKVTPYAIAHVLNYAPSHIHNLLSGRTDIGKKINNTVLRLSKGKISFHDICKVYLENDVRCKINHLNKICKDAQYSLNKMETGVKP